MHSSGSRVISVCHRCTWRSIWSARCVIERRCAAAAEVVEEDKLFRISVELPGAESKDVDVSLSGNTLVIKGKKKDERETQAQSYYLREREYGSFERFIDLPVGVDPDRIEAEFANGVLTVLLPKTAEAARKHKKIAIKNA